MTRDTSSFHRTLRNSAEDEALAALTHRDMTQLSCLAVIG